METCATWARSSLTCRVMSAIWARAESESFCSSDSCRAMAARACSSVTDFAAAVFTSPSSSSRSAVSACTWLARAARSAILASTVALSAITVRSNSVFAAASWRCASASWAAVVAACCPVASERAADRASWLCSTARRLCVDWVCALLSASCATRRERSACSESRVAAALARACCNVPTWAFNWSRAVLAVARSRVRPATAACSSTPWPRSSESMSVSSAIWWFSRSSARSLPDNATPRNAWASTNTSSTKMMTISSVDSAST